MTRSSIALAGLFLAGASTPTLAWDRDGLDSFGWGARYNGHLSEYDGRPLGPPLPALPPGYFYYNGRLAYSPYAYDGRTYLGAVHVHPRYVAKPHRTTRARSAQRQR
jgi:hypothetical protein